MKTRLLSAAVGIAVAVVALTLNLTYPWVLCVVLAAVACMCLFELLVSTKYIRNPAVITVSFIYTVIMLFIPYFAPHILGRLVAAASVAYVISMFFILMVCYKKLTLEKLAIGMVSTAIIVFPFLSAICMYLKEFFGAFDGAGTVNFNNALAGQSMIIFCFIASWGTDTGAYFAGRLFGKHKLAPEISPKKTVEGAIGGVFVGIGMSALAAYLCTVVWNVAAYEVNWINLLIVSAVASVVSMLGDLSFSMFKRACNIKDFGNIMPGHGGILDRFDSVIFVCPTVFALDLFLPILVR